MSRSLILSVCLVSAFAFLATVEASEPSCRTVRLYRNNFEGGSGLDGWTTGFLFGNQGTTNDWRGIQACTARSGDNVFRFGGETCTGEYVANQVSYAQPPSLQVPAGARGTRLTLWHRRNFEDGKDGGRLALRVDSDPIFYFAQDAAIVSGATHNGTMAGDCGSAVHFLGMPVFTGTSASFESTVVDLDAVCNVATSGTAGCAGHTISAGLLSFTNCETGGQGWFVDDVEVTTCVPPAPTAFYTVTPCRIVDTRNISSPELQPGAERSFTLTGRCGIPATARAVAVNVTIVQSSSPGHVQIWPADEAATSTSIINFSAGQTRANNAVLVLPWDGSGAVKALAVTAAPLHFVIDVTGYFE